MKESCVVILKGLTKCEFKDVRLKLTFSVSILNLSKYFLTFHFHRKLGRITELEYISCFEYYG